MHMLALPLALLLATLAAPTPPAIGAKVPEFSAKDVNDRTHTLSDFRSKKAIVVVFVGTECPISNLYILTLTEMHQKYAPKGVQILAINSNDHDSYAEVVAHAKERTLPYPVLKDTGHTAADALGARRTPEAFVLDSEFVIRYNGRIDDQYGYSYRRASPSKTELRDAVEDILAGRPVATPRSEVQGCVIGRSKKSTNPK
jgi:peroxiredoxin